MRVPCWESHHLQHHLGERRQAEIQELQQIQQIQHTTAQHAARRGCHPATLQTRDPFHSTIHVIWARKKHWHQISPQSTVGAIPMLTIPRHIRSWMEQAAAPSWHHTITHYTNWDQRPCSRVDTWLRWRDSGHIDWSPVELLIVTTPHIWCGVPPGGHTQYYHEDM